MYKDTRLGGMEKWYHIPPKDAFMRIPDDITKCVCFLCYKITNGDYAGTYRAIGTCFFVEVREFNYSFIYIATAKHLLDEMERGKLKELHLRLNRKDGEVGYIGIDLEKSIWMFSSNEADDLAFIHIQIPYTVFDILPLPIEMFATYEIVAKQKIGLGEELFATGLFTHRQGVKRNFPIIRTGIVSAMPEEPIWHKKSGKDFQAYVAEMRSIGGLSGSPVFVYLDEYRNPKPDLPEGVDYLILLLGLVRGHWELDEDEGGKKIPKKNNFEFDVRLGYSKGENLNVGIALITPAQILYTLLMHEKVRNDRKQIAEMLKMNEDTFIEDGLQIEEAIFSNEDFNNALKKVSRKTSEPVSEKKQTSE